jgi:serine/threonine protein kinase
VPDDLARRAAAIPEDCGPMLDDLGNTQIVAFGDPSVSGVKVNAAANYTEFSPSRILGKNLVTLGDFKLLRKLGEGAMGAVYKATWISRQRIVALKILFPHVANNPKLVKRLNREGRMMFELTHPNIVSSFGNFEIPEKDGSIYHCVAMEYVSGQSAQRWLSQLGRLPVGDSVRIAIDCAKALAYAHARNVIHRDIKPDNILLAKNGVPKVADLGMAKTDEDMSLTQTGHAVGTPWFMPLEQAKNAKEIDGRSDIYALGCTLYAFLTGAPPFTGQTIVDIIQAKEIGTFPPARQANADVPERLDLIIAKMTAKLPKYRYQNCEEVIAALEGLGLAGQSLTFLQPRETVGADETPLPGQTHLTAVAKSQSEDDFAGVAEATHDPDVWYVQVKLPDGTVEARKYHTAQLQTMIEEGTIGPTAQASHYPEGGFRTLATYKEFQGVAMSQLSKKAADKTTAKYRGIYKKLEEADRAAAAKERAADQEESPMRANTRYWLGIVLKLLPIPACVVLFIVILWLIAKFAF